MEIPATARVLWTATVPVEFADERIFGQKAHALSWGDAMRVTPRCIVPVRVAAIAVRGWVREAIALVIGGPGDQQNRLASPLPVMCIWLDRIVFSHPMFCASVLRKACILVFPNRTG